MSHRILICDDEPHIALALGMKFRNAGFEVQTARNGQEGWESILESPPDLLITDCTMPRMDGLELCRRIRGISSLQDLPIFMLTARGLELDPFIIHDELAISKLILKPFSPRDLFNDVQEALGLLPETVGASG
ncbi:MAG TPA: response regulator [Planctomycetaceae bacterium]|nr:response regulator [Planctomycetaceae bacterium]